MRGRMHFAVIGLALVMSLPGVAAGQTEPPALTGSVGFADQALMEGVLVSARKIGTSITITVVSDKDGRFSFPASKISPGEYSLAIRAIGYELEEPTKIEISGENSSAIN